MARMRTLLFAFIVIDILVIGFVMVLVSNCCNRVYSTGLISTKDFNSTATPRLATHDKSICEPNSLLGRMDVNSSYVPLEWEAIQSAGEHVKHGCYEPPDCVANQSVAIIVPFKNRDQHLLTLMMHLHPILQRQKLRYCVFVPEQYDDGAFNKARVMNAGVLEILKSEKYDFDCLIFNDVDMLVEDDRNLHRCQDFPRHLSPAIDKFNYTVDYGTHFGGVGAIKTGQYFLINGHSNRFYGWGGEDSDLETRLHLNNIDSASVTEDVGRYKMIPHDHPWSFNPATGLGSSFNTMNQRKRNMFRKWKSTDKSGLSTIKYSVKGVQNHTLYTKFTLDVRVFLIRNASSSFDEFNHKIEVENPFLTNGRRDGTTSKKIFGFGIEDLSSFSNANCAFHNFPGKVINKVGGLVAPEIYDKAYLDVTLAKEECLKIQENCSAVLVKNSTHFYLRSSPFMHENELHYKVGPISNRAVKKHYGGQSVHVKVCPRDTRYLQYLKTPVHINHERFIMRRVAHSTQFDLIFFQTEHFELYYSYSLYSSLKASTDHREMVENKTALSVNSMNIVFSDKVLAFNSSDNKTYSQFLGEYSTLEEIATSNGFIRVQAPVVTSMLFPGCYICESSIVDQNFVTHLKWSWWFEVRGSSRLAEDSLRDLNLPRAEMAGSARTQLFIAQFRRSNFFHSDAEMWMHLWKNNRTLFSDEI